MESQNAKFYIYLKTIWHFCSKSSFGKKNIFRKLKEFCGFTTDLATVPKDLKSALNSTFFYEFFENLKNPILPLLQT